MALILVLFLFYKGTEAPPPQYMSPLGPGASMLKKSGGDMTKGMTPTEKEMYNAAISRGGSPPMPAGVKPPAGKAATR